MEKLEGFWGGGELSQDTRDHQGCVPPRCTRVHVVLGEGLRQFFLLPLAAREDSAGAREPVAEVQEHIPRNPGTGERSDAGRRLLCGENAKLHPKRDGVKDQEK